MRQGEASDDEGKTPGPFDPGAEHAESSASGVKTPRRWQAVLLAFLCSGAGHVFLRRPWMAVCYLAASVLSPVVGALVFVLGGSSLVIVLTALVPPPRLGREHGARRSAPARSASTLGRLDRRHRGHDPRRMVRSDRSHRLHPQRPRHAVQHPLPRDAAHAGGRGPRAGRAPRRRGHHRARPGDRVSLSARSRRALREPRRGPAGGCRGGEGQPADRQRPRGVVAGREALHIRRRRVRAAAPHPLDGGRPRHRRGPQSGIPGVQGPDHGPDRGVLRRQRQPGTTPATAASGALFPTRTWWDAWPRSGCPSTRAPGAPRDDRWGSRHGL